VPVKNRQYFKKNSYIWRALNNLGDLNGVGYDQQGAYIWCKKDSVAQLTSNVS